MSYNEELEMAARKNMLIYTASADDSDPISIGRAGGWDFKRGFHAGAFWSHERDQAQLAMMRDALEIGRKALSLSNPSRRLERVKRLEAVAEAATEWYDQYFVQGNTDIIGPARKTRAALTALFLADAEQLEADPEDIKK